jgi:hypothetical protein
LSGLSRLAAAVNATRIADGDQRMFADPLVGLAKPEGGARNVAGGCFSYISGGTIAEQIGFRQIGPQISSKNPQAALRSYSLFCPNLKAPVEMSNLAMNSSDGLTSKAPPGAPFGHG